MTLRVGVIGTGAIGKTHIQRLTHSVSGARMVAVNDVTEGQAAVDSLQVDAKAYATGQELINAADVDAVVVAFLGGLIQKSRLTSSTRPINDNTRTFRICGKTILTQGETLS